MEVKQKTIPDNQGGTTGVRGVSEISSTEQSPQGHQLRHNGQHRRAYAKGKPKYEKSCWVTTHGDTRTDPQQTG